MSESREADNEAALVMLESVMLAQGPHQPWAPVTDYSYEGRVSAEGKHPDLILGVLQPRGTILDYGAGPGHLARMLRERGVVVDESDIGYEPAGSYDLVICREVLEHVPLRHVGSVVVDLCTRSSRLVYLTTRFAPAWGHVLDVQTSDDLDPTHISMLNQSLVRALFVLHGFKRRDDLERRMDWKGLGRVLVYERV